MKKISKYTDEATLVEGLKAKQPDAITLEKEGGVPSPTLSELYVLGSIGS